MKKAETAVRQSPLSVDTYRETATRQASQPYFCARSKRAASSAK
jgi:hypothetical protein